MVLLNNTKNCQSESVGLFFADVSNNTDALYDLFTTSREGQGLLREFKRMNDDPERAEEPIRYVQELYVPFVISVLEVWEELKMRGWTELE